MLKQVNDVPMAFSIQEEIRIGSQEILVFHAGLQEF